MVVSPFTHRPESLFFGRILPVLGGVFALGFLVLGIWQVSRSSRGLAFTVATTPWSAASAHYAKTIGGWTNAPKHCRGDAAVNDFQREQCAQYWSEVSAMTVWAAVPAVIALLFFLFIRGRFRAFYRRVDRRFGEGKAVAAAKVLRSGGRDWFGYFFCLKSVRVELGQGRDVRVYVPRDLPQLLPGQKVALFYGGKIFGARRYVGLLYAPHIAVMAGTRG